MTAPPFTEAHRRTLEGLVTWFLTKVPSFDFDAEVAAIRAALAEIDRPKEAA